MFWKLLKDHFLLNLNVYFDGVDFPITIFLILMALCLSVAFFFITMRKRQMAIIIKRLIRVEAFDEERARTLVSLRIPLSFSTRRSLSRIGQLTGIVSVVGGYPFESDDEGKRKEKIDFTTAKFFIGERGKARAMKIAEGGVPSYLNTFLGCVLTVMLFATVSIFLPEILHLLTGRG